MFKAAYSYKENGKWTYKIVQVYDVSYDKHGYPLFLIYFKGQWLRRSGKFFAPTEVQEVKSIKDFLGNELNIGDEVVALAHQRTSSTLYRGRISKFTKSMVVINTEGYDSDWRFSETMRVSPEKVVKISSNINQ